MSTVTDVLAGIQACGVVAVIRADSGEEAVRAVAAVRDGGVKAIEVTFTVPNAEKIIAQLHQELGDSIYLGAGTVTSVQQAQMAIEAGAQYLISPGFDPEVVQYALGQGVTFMPGVLTPSEILAARKLGVEVFKIFPASRMGAAYIKDLRGPFPGIKLVPTGGVDVGNAADYIKAGAFALGVGGKLVDKAAIKAGNWQALTDTAKELLRVVAEARA
ncbi:MAG TPA: bifunctional 4-hydroxy-2-oxoglutarate aldolase/2-dehydro-3-deoxy-phosphogluconate aldolase [Armatimonadota bacterium]